jgi:O-methyltransferase
MSGKMTSALNDVLSTVGLSVIRSSTHVRYKSMERDLDRCWPQFLDTIEEMEAAAREILFSDLQPKKGRSEFMAYLQGTRRWEAFYLLAYLHRALQQEGDVCELGVAQGYTSALIASEIKHTNKRFNLFDSFQGLSKPTKEDELIDDVLSLGSMDRYEGTMAFPVAQVLSQIRRAEFPKDRIKVYEGFIEASIKRPDLPQKVCFAYIDFDLYLPIKQALEMLHDRVPPGGVLMVDDYGYLSTGVKKAVDEFCLAFPGIYDAILPKQFAGHFIVLQKQRTS